MVTGAPGGAADAVAGRVDRGAEVGDDLRGAEQGADLQAGRQEAGGAEGQPGEGRRGEHGGQDAELGFLQLGAGEGEGRDQDGHREADSGDRADAGDGHPADGRPEPSPAQAGEQPRRAGDAEGLARDVADEDAQGDGGGVGAGEEGAAERDARVGEREQRDDEVAGPGMVELLQPLVRGQRRGEPGARRLRQVGGRLLAEAAEQVAGPFQVGPGRRVGDGQQPHHQADDDRVDAGLQDRDPRRDPRRRVDDPGPDPGPAQEQDHGEDPGRDAQRD